MGKHKNTTQMDIFLNFMEKNSDIAKGFTKRDKQLVDSLWRELSDSLNSAGPPNKDISGWKKTWSDLKFEVKKKLARSKEEVRATGGGPFCKFALTPTEEAIVRICGIAKAVEGVPGVALGQQEDIEAEVPATSKHARSVDSPNQAIVRICGIAKAVEDVTGVALGQQEDIEAEVPATSKHARSVDSRNQAFNTPKRHKADKPNDRLIEFLEENVKWKKEMCKKIEELVKVEQENANSLRRIYRNLEKGSESVAKEVSDLKDSIVNFASHMLQVMQDRTNIEREQVNLDISKFEFEKNKKFSM